MSYWNVRTAEEIQQRLRVSGDMFGWEPEVIGPYLTFEESRGYASDSEGEWATIARPRTAKAIAADARAYLDYAWRCALNHRNIPSQRAMVKLDRYCWLLGADLARFEPDDPDKRGTMCVRALAAAAAYLDVAFPPTHYRETIDQPRIALTEVQRSKLTRMWGGKPCEDGCIGIGKCLPDPAEEVEQVEWTTT